MNAQMVTQGLYNMPPTRELSYADIMTASTAALTFVEAQQVWDLWNRYPEATSAGQGEAQDLQKISDRLNECLSRCVAQSEALAELAQRRPSMLEDSLRRGPALENLVDEQIATVRGYSNRHGGLNAVASAAPGQVTRIIEVERAEITRRLGGTADTNAPVERMTKDFACNLAGGMLIGGFFAGATPVGWFAIGFGAGFIAGMEVAGNAC